MKRAGNLEGNYASLLVITPVAINVQIVVVDEDMNLTERNFAQKIVCLEDMRH